MSEDTEKNLLTSASMAGSRIQKFAASLAVATALYNRGKQFYDAQRSKRTFVITIKAGTDLFIPVEQWLLDQLPPANIRHVEAISSKWVNAGGQKMKRHVLATFDSAVNQEMIIAGYPVRVTTQKDQPSLDLSTGDIFDSSPRGSGAGVPFGPPKKTIRIECKSAEARDAILKVMDELLREHDREDSGTRCFVLGSWANWNRRDFLTKRALDTVYLPDGMVDEVANDMRLFLNSEPDYLKLGLPWHRGYLFTGEPGTGKTSLAKALSNHFDLDIYVIALPDLKKDTDLNNALTQIEAPAVLLIEDIDVATAASSREEHEDTVSLSGLLNALDGVGTPHGLITVMTSNHPEVLDPALVRAGRVDYRMECPPLKGEELQLMVQGILDMPVSGKFRDSVIAADVMEVLKRNMHSEPDVAMQELLSKFGQ